MTTPDPRFLAAFNHIFAVPDTVTVPGWFPKMASLPEPATDTGDLPESLPPVTVLRPYDLVYIEFRFVNLHVENNDSAPFLARKVSDRPAYLIAGFGAQHLMEEAFFESAGSRRDFAIKVPDNPHEKARADDPAGNERPNYPVAARLSQSSRLAYVVTGQRIPYSERGLLAAMRVLPLHVVPHAESPAVDRWWPPVIPTLNDLQRLDLVQRNSGRATETVRLRHAVHELALRFGPSSAAAAVGNATTLGHRAQGGRIAPIDRRPPPPRKPEAHESSIELPSRLQLSPNSHGAFAHSIDEVEHDGRVELWHSRLSERTPVADTIDDIDADGASPVDEISSPQTVRAVWSRDFGTNDAVAQGTEPEKNVIQAPWPFRSSLSERDRWQLVQLTSNHRYPKAHRSWSPTAVPVENLLLTALGGWLACDVHFPDDLPPGLSIEEWRHRTTMGRDHYAKVVYQGVLLPFGHRASMIKVTERRVTSDGRATLYQRLFVVVREPDRRFLVSGVPEFDNTMPFQWVRILTPSTPPLAKPVKLASSLAGQVFVGQIFVPSLAATDEPQAGTQSPDTEPFRFRILALDMDAHLIEFEGPLVFVERTVFETDDATSRSACLAANTALPIYSMRGQRISYAPPGDTDDTSLATNYIRFEALFDKTTAAASRNFVMPVMKEALAPVPAMVAFTGQTHLHWLHYADAYRAHAFGGAGKNDGELFLELGSAGTADATMGFGSQADKSGAFVTPSVDVKALARRVGPVGGDLAALTSNAGAFDVRSMFGLSAKLFGVLPLVELLPTDNGTLPMFVTQTVSTAVALQNVVEELRDIVDINSGALQSHSPKMWETAREFALAAESFDDAAATVAKDPTHKVELDAILARVLTTARDLSGVFPASGLPRPVLEHAVLLLDRLTSISSVTDAAKGIRDFYSGRAQPEVMNARLEWETVLDPWPKSSAAKVFIPHGDRTLRLNSENQAPLTASGSSGTAVSCSLPPFDLSPTGRLEFIVVSIEVMEFSVRRGRKPDVNVVLAGNDGIKFGGPLAFVEGLKSIIPFDGFSDPPYLDVSPNGAKAGFDLAIPDLPVGIFALTNIHVGAELSVPFIGESLEFRFFFATREDPFRLQVAFFAGGGFFALTLSPQGVRVLEAALEFGAAVELSFVVARGSISVMAGIYFRLELLDDEQTVQLTGYFRARGEVDVLGLISACIELYLELSYRAVTIGGQTVAKAVGKASISVEVSVCFASFSVTITCERQFAGSRGDPTFVDMMSPYVDSLGAEHHPWAEYCEAFATEPEE
ncbi:hypothetical protein [Rhodococcus rhodochrous]|uniref:hypothetical protein n=1 Tax=Rhodococcus rhodochrous TaxID=1829 RepID=UPI0023F8CCE5